MHRTDLEPADIEMRDDVPVSSALRTAWDVAALETMAIAVAALDAMVRNGAVDGSGLARMVEAGAGHWGVSRVRRAVDLVDPRAESPPESWVRVALTLAGLRPVPQYEVWADGEWLARVDLAFPEERVVIEYEGTYHFDGIQIAYDDVRLRRLVEAGWRVIRLSAADLRDLDSVVARIRHELGL